MITELTIWIASCSCRCGNKWTHSYVTYPTGGTPTLVEQDKLPVTCIIPIYRNHSHCFRCAPLGLNIGWTRPKIEPASKPSVDQAIDDLMKD